MHAHVAAFSARSIPTKAFRLFRNLTGACCRIASAWAAGERFQQLEAIMQQALLSSKQAAITASIVRG